MSERDQPVSALRTHVPDLERLADNQKPKTRDWTYLCLLQYDGTDLFQWFGKRNGSCFEDQASEPFRIPARRTPAPEGEAWLWGCADGNGIDPRYVFRDRPTAEQVAADTNMVVQPLYASPVVPVGVSRETLLKAVRPVLDRHPMIDSSQSHKLDIQAGWVADAIIAALTGEDAATLGLSGETQTDARTRGDA
jgi:hypothetical protein